MESAFDLNTSFMLNLLDSLINIIKEKKYIITIQMIKSVATDL